MKTKLKKGDNVIVTCGKDKGKEGKIVEVDRKNNRVLVQGVNKVTKHAKPSATNNQGGIMHQEAFLDASNAMYVHKGKPTKLGIKVEQVEKDGRTKNVRKRFAKSTGDVIDK